MVSGSRVSIPLLVLLVLLALGCAAILEEAQRGVPAPAAAGPVVFTPWLSLEGARVAAAAAPGGVPIPQGAQPFVRFVQPVAVAARAGEIYVADAGLGAVYRYDVGMNAMVQVTGAVVQPGVQIELAQDRSLLVVEGAARRVTQLVPGGARIDLSAAAIDLGRPVDVAGDDARGRILVADGLLRQVLAWRPAGRAFELLPLRGDAGGVQGLAAIAAAPRGMYLLDPVCRCVWLATPDGRLLGAIGRGELEAPAAIAADSAGRLYVADAAPRSLRVFTEGKLTQTVAYRTLGVTEVTDLKVADGALYIADGPGARIEVRRVGPQRAGVAR